MQIVAIILYFDCGTATKVMHLAQIDVKGNKDELFLRCFNILVLNLKNNKIERIIGFPKEDMTTITFENNY